MSAELFKEWFFNEFVPRVKAFLRENGLPEEALLLIDNAPSHPSLKQLKYKGFLVKFLPLNTTSLFQPMDQGVIVSWKRYYRQKLLQEILLNCDENDVLLNCLINITMKDVVYWSAEAWQSVKASTLRRAWSKNLRVEFVETENVRDDMNLSKLLKKIPGCSSVVNEDIQKWVSADDNVLDLNDDEIVEFVKEDNLSEATNDPVNSDEKISYDEAFEALEKSLSFIETQKNVTPNELLVFRKWRNFAAERRINSKTNQCLITNYFKK